MTPPIDPHWAWSEYQPDATRPWNLDRAAHLCRRATFSADFATLQQIVQLGPAAAVDALLCAPEMPESIAFDRQVNDLDTAVAARGDAAQLSSSWLYRIRNTPDPLREKVTLFWHGHFATSADKVTDARLMRNQLSGLRSMALGHYPPLVRAIARDPAMLTWLDSTTNRRIQPNENFARELLELFCLGPGHYTERDIKEVARAFTGYEVTAGAFRFNASQHDTGSKSFLGSTGPFDGDDAIRIILQHPAASRFIARKLVRFFLMDEPPEGHDANTLCEPLAQQLRENNFHIAPVLRRILLSNLFYSEHAMARIVRSPVDMAVGLLRATESRTDFASLAAELGRLGQALYFPPNVKGWDAGRAWVSSSTLLGRANLVSDLFLNGRASPITLSLAQQSARDGATSPESAVDRLITLLLATPLPHDARQALINLAADGSDLNRNLARVVHALSTTPEFLLG